MKIKKEVCVCVCVCVEGGGSQQIKYCCQVYFLHCAVIETVYVAYTPTITYISDMK